MQNQTGDDFTDKLQLFLHTKEVNDNQAKVTAGLKSGSRCPECKLGLLDYDGTLNLVCNQCKTIASAGGACT